MALKAPDLDNRRFQEILDEARRRIRNYCPDWSDHNVSDPGIMLVELFAYMTDMILYRLNQVPERHYIKFLEMLGVRLRGPNPARTEVTFLLNEPLVESKSSKPVVIPAFTEIATTQTETEQALIFTTEQEINIEPPELREVMTGKANDEEGHALKDHNVRWFRSRFEGIKIFSPVPEVGDALFLGFDNDLSYHVLKIDLDFEPASGLGVYVTKPPYVWECSTGDPRKPWQELDDRVEDSTKVMSEPGVVTLYLPEMGRAELGEQGYYWIRVRVKNITEEQKQRGVHPFVASPVLRGIKETVIGGSVMASHLQIASRELLGESDGMPNQRFYLLNKPVLPRKLEMHEHLIVEPPGEEAQIWREVPDFADSAVVPGAMDKHFVYTLDGETGELRFGPAVPKPEGGIRQYGAIPPRRSMLYFESYRYGGGAKGNIPKNSLNTLKTSNPFVKAVVQHNDATGGRDAQSLEEAKVTVPAELRSSDRAVTAADYEYLVCEKASYAVGRVKCIQPQPDPSGRTPAGPVYIVVIPRLKLYEEKDFDDPLDMRRLELKEELIQDLRSYLDERRLLTTRLEIRAPQYQWIAARVQVKALPGADKLAIVKEAKRRLYRYLNPLTGGDRGTGWDFGKEVLAPDLFQPLQGISGVMNLREISLFNCKPGGEPEGKPMLFIDLVSHGMVLSGRHTVEVV